MKRADENVTIKEAFNQFILIKKSEGLSEATIFGYNASFWDFISVTDTNENEQLNLITYEDIMNYISKKTCSKTSINHYLGSIRVFLYWAMSQDYLPSFSIKLMKTQEEKIKFYTEDGLKVLLKKPAKKDNFTTWRTYAIICFMLATGARASTVCNIKFEDIDLTNKEVTYTHLKNKKLSTVPLSSQLVSVLSEYMRMWKRDKKEWFFCDMYENQLTVNALRLSVNKYCESRGVVSKSVHAFRHSFSRQWIKNNGNAFALQHMLSHSDLQMTKKYVRLFENDLKQGFDDYSPLDILTSKGSVKRAK